MYGNNFGGPFITPSMSYGPMMRGMSSPMIGMMSGPMMQGAGAGMRGISSSLGTAKALGRGRGILSGLRGLNWGGMLGNVSKTLGVVKEAIPIVKEVGPMMNNMKSMLKIASVFKDATDKDVAKKENTDTSPPSKEKDSDIQTEDTTTTSKITDNKPNFFL